MQLTIDKDAFQKAVAGVQGVVDRRGTLPILSHVLIKANGDVLDLLATDLEIYYRGQAPAQVTEKGGVTVSAAKLFSLLKELPPGEVEIHTTARDRLIIRRGESKYTLNGLSQDQYPEPPVPQAEMLEITSKTLKDTLAKVLYSVSADDMNYHLSSILLESAKDKPLRMVSTDGHRLTLINRPLAHLASESPILLPAKGAREIVRFLEGDTVQIGISGNNNRLLHLQDGNRQLSIRLMDKNFPEYRRIIPDGWAHGFTFRRQELINALKRLTVLSSERFRMVLFELGQENAELIFESPEEGEGREELPITNYSGDGDDLPLKINLNARYLLEPLQAMTGAEAVLQINEGDRPCRIMDPADPDYFSIVMPASL
jgi:DNA polymerase-3 subunit beta